MSVSIRKTLVIGLGGTGIRALQYIKGEFLKNFGSVPRAVKLLGIDTDLQKDISGIDRPIAQLDRPEYMHVELRGVRKFIKAPELASWVLPEHKLSFHDIKRGAGQRRVSGRIAFFSRAADIKQRLESAHVDLLGIGADGTGLNSLEDGSPIIEGHDEAEIEVYVVGSLAGGTGSGMFLDLGYLLKDLLGVERHRVIGMFLMPKVFSRSVDASEYVEGNGYAALKELDYWMSREQEEVVRYPREIATTWGGCNFRKPFDLVYLIDDINEQGFRVRDMETLQSFCARSLFLHMTIESQSVESFWRNLEEILEDEPNWEGMRPQYLSLGMSTLEVPLERSVDLLVSEKAIEILDELAPSEFEETPSLHEATLGSVKTFLEEESLTTEKLLLRFDADQPIAIREHGFERIEAETPTSVKTWVERARQQLSEDIASRFDPNGPVFAELLRQAVAKFGHYFERTICRHGSQVAARHMLAIGRLLDSDISALRAIRERPQAALQEPDYDRAFKGFLFGRRARKLVSSCGDYLAAERENRAANAKLGMVIALLTALRSQLRILREEIVPSFERTVSHARIGFRREVSRVKRREVREAFTENLGTQLLGIDFAPVTSQIDVEFLNAEWARSRWAVEGAMKESSTIDLRTGLLSWGMIDPDELVDWMQRAIRAKFGTFLQDSVDERLANLWENDLTRSKLREKIDSFTAKASPLWQVTPPHDRIVRYHMLFGIAERKDGSHGFLRRVLEDSESGLSLLTIDGRQMPDPTFANTWERYNFRALKIAVPAAAYAMEHMRSYREKYLQKESIETSRFSHHMSRAWMGIDGLPDLFPLSE